MGAVITSSDPVDGAIDVPINKQLSVDMDVDPPGTLDKTEINVRIDPDQTGVEDVIINGVFAPGWSGTIDPPIVPDSGHSLTISRDIDWPNGVTVDVFVNYTLAADDPSGDSFQFTTVAAAGDANPPTTSNKSPADGATDVSTTPSVTVDIEDAEGNYDQLQTIIVVAVDSVTPGPEEVVYDGSLGGFQPGWSGTVQPLANGESFSATPDNPLVNEQLYEFVVSGGDTQGNPFSELTTFTTESAVDVTDPVVQNLSPADGAPDVPAANARIEFDVVDPESGINLASIDLSIVTPTANAEAIITGGVVQSGWTGSVTAIANGFHVDVIRDSRLEYETTYGLELIAEQAA